MQTKSSFQIAPLVQEVRDLNNNFNKFEGDIACIKNVIVVVEQIWKDKKVLGKCPVLYTWIPRDYKQTSFYRKRWTGKKGMSNIR